MTRLWWVALLVLLLGCASDYKSRLILWGMDSPLVRPLLRHEMAPGQIVFVDPDPAHAAALAKVQAEPRRPYTLYRSLEAE